MTESIKANLAYLATVYSKHPGGIGQAFVDAAKLSARLIKSGINCYSPIAHTHPIALYGGLNPLDLSLWLPFDRAMLNAAEVLLVAHMQGWQDSHGIAYEVAYFEQTKKPIYDLDPVTLTMARRKPSAPPRERYENLTDSQIREQVESYLNPTPQGANA